MTLTHILIFCAVTIILGLIRRHQWQHWLILAFSVVAIYWMQPVTPIRQLDFWLPTATILLTLLTWIVLQSGKDDAWAAIRSSLPGVALVIVLVLGVAALRYLGEMCCITPSAPPPISSVLLGLLLASMFAGVLFILPLDARYMMALLILLFIALMIILKTPPLTAVASAWLRTASNQSPEQASALDIRWLGISYVFFRLVHVLRDRQSGLLPALPLHHFVEYVLFFPTYTAGPIDRAERFWKDINTDFQLSWQVLYAGGQRIVLGLFKKFVLADSLAILALDATKATQVDSALWTWLMLYAYAYRIYFDFAGLSDIAIGLGRLMGLTIPKNFDSPYRKSDLTAFWNSWHITLAAWFRAYYFNAVSRGLHASRLKLTPPIIIAFSQITTMVLIGMWHLNTLNFILWGLGHGIGLFIHNRWANVMKPRIRKLDTRPRLKAVVAVTGTLLTFHFVVLNWVWFALPSIPLALMVFQRLFGFNR